MLTHGFEVDDRLGRGKEASLEDEGSALCRLYRGGVGDLFVAGANFGDHAGALVLTCAAVGLLAALAGDLPEGSIRERVQLSARARVVLGAAAVALGLTAAALVDSYFPVVVTVVLCVFLVPNRRKRSGTN